MKRFRKILIICFVILLASLIILTILDVYQIIDVLLDDLIMFTLLGLLLIPIFTLVIVLAIGKGFCNFSLWLIPFSLIGLVFRINNWPGAALMIFLGFGLYAVGLIAIAIRSIIIFRGNKYIQITGFVASLIMSITIVGLLFIINRYRFGDIISLLGTLFYVIFIIFLMFTLPGVNYVKWSNQAKKFFYRSIVVPLIFIFIFNTVFFVFPSTYERLFLNISIDGLEVKELQFKDKEGI